MMVSIIIPYAGPLSLLKECLNGIKENTDTGYELIIVGDRCNDEALDYLLSLYKEGVRLVLNPELVGITRAVNYGLKIARGEYLCFVMTDIKVAPSWLEVMGEALDNFPYFGWVALSAVEAPGFNAGISMMRREVLDKVGFWDEAFSDGNGFMDDDFLRRVWRAGYIPHIVTDVPVSHKDGGGKTTYELHREAERTMYLRNQEIFYQKWGETGTNWNALPGIKVWREQCRLG